MPLTLLPSKIPVVCAGVLVADHLTNPLPRLPEAGEVIAADDLVLNIGGCAANAAMVLAKLGIRATLCGRVGGDTFGHFIAQTLEAAGVDLYGLAADPTRSTSQSLILNVEGQDRRFIHSFGANKGLTAADLDPLLSLKPQVLYLGGYLILPGIDPEALAERFRRARAQGTITILDVVTPGPADYLPRLAPVLAEVDVFLPNTDEATLILGETDPLLQARAFRALGARRVVVTRGAAGSVSVSDDLEIKVGAYPITYVDGTGGGDAFDAGYVAGILGGLDEVGCLRLASAIGASCVRAVGTTAGLFTRPEADAFIAANDLPMERFS